jgi:hypothetical protein
VLKRVKLPAVGWVWMREPVRFCSNVEGISKLRGWSDEVRLRVVYCLAFVGIDNWFRSDTAIPQSEQFVATLAT